MKADLSRSTFRAANHYSSVRLQQGRVLMDADWNEQADIDRHMDRTTTVDVIGPTGAPKHDPTAFLHFKVAVEGNGGDLRIAPGRIYVDGLLCENDEPNGTLFTQQGDLPGAALPTTPGSYAVYLDVWERHVAPVDQTGGDFPPLRETALNGPDTATRTRIVWQVKLALIDTKTCGAFTPPADPTGMLRAEEVKSSNPVDDCLVPSGGGYRRLENQLYRVEIHDIVQNTTSFKWSRDNGSIVSKVKAIDANALTIVVDDPGRDETLGFASAKFVELTDEERILAGRPGALFQVKTVTGASVVVLNPSNLSFTAGTNPTLRRWDGTGTVAANQPVELEDGVQIEFDDGTFASGDYWLIPARTLTGKVEWPRNGGNPPTPIFEKRHGIAHHYCPLGVVDLTGGLFSAPLDCRQLFPPLTDIAASDVSYDPGNCPNLANAHTVQEAIDILCKGSDGAEPGIRIQNISLLSGKPLLNDSLVDPQELARGLRIVCDQAPFQNSVRNLNGLPNPVCLVTLDLPWPLNPTDREMWKVPAAGVMGYQTTTLAGNVNADGNAIFWVPVSQEPNNVQQWLSQNVLTTIFNQTHGQVQRVLARLMLKGNFIWAQQDPKLYLDGEAFGVRGDGRTDLQLPSGNGRRGGDFEMWFWLATPPPPTPTVTTPTLTIPTVTFTIPTLTLPTLTIPTLTVPTLTLPTLTATVTHPTIVTVPTHTLPTIVGPTPPIVHGGGRPTVIVPPRGRETTSRPLTAVKGLTRAQAKKLDAEGISDVAALAAADPRDVAAALGLRDRGKAEALIEDAKRLPS